MDTETLNALATAALIVPQDAQFLREIADYKDGDASAGKLASVFNSLMLELARDHIVASDLIDMASESADVLAGMLNPFATVSRVAVNGDVWVQIGAPGSLVHDVCGQSKFAGVVYRVSVSVAGVEIPALSHLQGCETEDGQEDTVWRVPASAMRDGVVNTWANFHHESIFDTLTN